MKTTEKLAAGWLLTVAFMFLAIAASALLDKPDSKSAAASHSLANCELDINNAPQKNRSTALGGIILGMPSLLLGGWLALGLYRRESQEKCDRLHSTFYHLLKQGNGHINVLRLAMETQLPAATAKQYLDEQAKEFNATFNVTDQGGIDYQFNEFSLLPTLEGTVSHSVTSSNNYWTLGSTRDEVLIIEGTPTKVTKSGGSEVFYYGTLNNVKFQNGRVYEYDNYDQKFKVFIKPSS